jgi:hypothetical protein
MKKVYQTIVSEKNGNCFASCISSLTKIPLKSIPDFFTKGDGKFWNESDKFLRKYNISAILLHNPMDINSLYLPSIVDTYAILTVPSQCIKGGLHAVVGIAREKKNGAIKFEILHDPNKRNKPYKKDVKIHSVIFLASTKPWKTIK